MTTPSTVAPPMPPPWELALLALALLAGAFVAGRQTAPVQTRDVERVEYRDRVVTVHAAAKVETRIVYRDRVVTRDGAVHEREVERSGTVESSASGAQETREGETLATHEPMAPRAPEWRVGILAGASLPTPLLPLAGPLVVGAHVERRILGPVSAGVWFLTSGAAGVSVSGEF